VGPGEDGKGCVPVRTKRADLRARYPKNHKLRPATETTTTTPAWGTEATRTRQRHTDKYSAPNLATQDNPNHQRSTLIYNHPVPKPKIELRTPHHPQHNGLKPRTPARDRTADSPPRALLPRAPPSRSFPRPSLARSTHALLPRAAPSRSSLVLISRPQLAPYALTCPNTNPKRNIQHHASTSPSSLTQGICTPPPPSLPLDRTRTSALYLHLSFLQPDPKHLHPTSAFPSSTLTYGNCATHPPSLPPA
jgi:hypothetical protein